MVFFSTRIFSQWTELVLGTSLNSLNNHTPILSDAIRVTVMWVTAAALNDDDKDPHKRITYCRFVDCVSAFRLVRCVLGCRSIQFISTRLTAPCSLPYSRGLFSVYFSVFFSSVLFNIIIISAMVQPTHTHTHTPTNVEEHGYMSIEQQSKMEKYFRTTSRTGCGALRCVALIIIMTLSSLCRFVFGAPVPFPVSRYVHFTFYDKKGNIFGDGKHIIVS